MNFLHYSVISFPWDCLLNGGQWLSRVILVLKMVLCVFPLSLASMVFAQQVGILEQLRGEKKPKGG